MSDLHGNYEAYCSMLEKINFGDEDVLYILGDILDRGPHPIKIILDLIERHNVIVLAGNHCMMACECFDFLLKEITEASIEDVDDITIRKFLNWQYNGADSTIEEFSMCDEKTRQAIIDFISDFELYEEVQVGGRKFILVHAGLGNFSPEKELWEYELHELVWERPDYNIPYFEDKYVITGHTPTQIIEGNKKPGYIYHANNHIAIDCGCHIQKGRLACLRLDDMKEFYVENNKKKLINLRKKQEKYYSLQNGLAI